MTGMRHDLDPGTAWALNNPHTPEGRAHLADLERRERIRQAHAPKRFLIRKAGPGLWAVRDNAKPHWVGSRMTHPGAIDMLNVLARHPHHLGEWDGVVRVTVRVPEEDLDEYPDDWEV